MIRLGSPSELSIPTLRSVNVVEGESKERAMSTGMHTVRDIRCCKCGTLLGWHYVCHLSLPSFFQEISK